MAPCLDTVRQMPNTTSYVASVVTVIIAALHLKSGESTATTSQFPPYPSATTWDTPAPPLLSALSSDLSANEPGISSGERLLNACRHGDAVLVGELLRNGGACDQLDESGFSALDLAAANGALKVVKLLLSTRLCGAVLLSNTEVAVASAGGHADVVRYLIESGAPLKPIHANTTSALHLASQHGHIAVVILLLDAGADANARDENGYTPLIVAAAHNHTELVKALCLQGADANVATNDDGNNALMYAAHAGNEDMVRVLLPYVDSVNQLGGLSTSVYPALILAARIGSVPILQLLLAAGADIDRPGGEGITALHVTVAGGHQDAVRVLVAMGANLEARTHSSETALTIACESHPEISVMLMDAGAHGSCPKGERRERLQKAEES